MEKIQDFLGKNARNWIYLRYNDSKSRKIADSKTKTKKRLKENGVPVPEELAVLTSEQEVQEFAWEKLEGNFVVKPVLGYGGEGILVVKRSGHFAGEWLTANGDTINIPDLRLHCQEILAGRFSLHGSASQVLIERRIKIHPKFLRFTTTGTPDVRVIIFNKVPVMAMLRVPTEESGGKANLQQGAMGLGIDLASGITTYGIRGKESFIGKIYDFKKKKLIKVNGIKIPEWNRVLEVAIQAQRAVPGLGFMGVDIFLDKDKGPVVVELNARPGLSIQMCNRAGMQKRLERLMGLSVRGVDHGIKIASNLFGESFVDRVKAEEETKVVEVLERVKIKKAKGKTREILAKIDTGAMRSSIDKSLAQELGLLDPKNIIFTRHYRNALGGQNARPVVALTFWLKRRKIKTTASVVDRSHLNTAVLVGRQDLAGFLVKPEPVVTKTKDSYRLLFK